MGRGHKRKAAEGGTLALPYPNIRPSVLHLLSLKKGNFFKTLNHFLETFAVHFLGPVGTA